MDRSSSSGSIGGITAPNTSPSVEEKITEKAKNKNKQPAMVSKNDKKDAASKRAAYAQSKDSLQTKASQNLPRFKEEEKSSSQSSSRVSSASASSSESEEETILPSTEPILSASSSTTKAASTSSTSAVDTALVQFQQKLHENGGVLFIGENTDVNAVCQWLASSAPGINVLRIGKHSITDLDINYLATALEKNTTVRHLQFQNCDVDAGALKSIVQTLQVNKFITSCSLSSCRVGDDGAEQFANLLKINTTLTSLVFNFNHIGSVGAKAIAEALKVNTTLIDLHINANNIGDDGVKAIAEALKVNTSLTVLNIVFNNKSAFGVEYLADALKVNSTLTTLNYYSNIHFDPTLTQSIESELEKNRQLLKEKESAKTALELINGEMGKTDNPGFLKYPREVMDLVVDQMAQVGLKDEVFDLAKSIKPKT